MNFLATVLRLVLGGLVTMFSDYMKERTANKNAIDLGAEQARNNGLEESLESAKNAQQYAENIKSMSDDELFDSVQSPDTDAKN